MIEYFAKDYTGEAFVLFGTGHLIALGIVLLVNLSFIFLRKSSNQKLKDGVRYTIIAALVISEGTWHIWNIAIGEWSIKTHLPFHLCAVFVFLSVYMLLSKNARIYEFAYFLGIGGALQPLLTPEAGIYGLPHFRAVQTLSTHGSIITAAVFMTVVEGYRPTWASIKRVLIWANIYLLFVTGVNLLLNSNYMYTLHKPDTASLLDMLGPWPVYLLAAEGIAVVLCLILYLPFAIKDRRKSV